MSPGEQNRLQQRFPNCEWKSSGKHHKNLFILYVFLTPLLTF
jgi:hypothetical protein